MWYRLWNPYTLFLLVTGLFSLCLSVYVQRSRSDAIAWSLTGLFIGAAVWSFADAIRLAAPTETAILTLNRMTYVGAALMPPSVVLFTAAYTGNRQWFRRRRIAALVGISTLMVLAVFTNPIHRLWRASETVSPGTPPPVISEQFGPIHVLWVAYVLLLVMPLVYVLLFRAYRSKTHSAMFRRQVTLLCVAYAVPFVASTVYVTGLVPVDPTPFGFMLTGLGLSVAVGQYRLLDVVPVARATVVENMDSGVLVLDRQGTVVDVNEAALAILDTEKPALLGTAVRDIVPELPPEAHRLLERGEGKETISVTDGGAERHYDVTISPLRDDDQHIGRVVIFSDVTQRIRRQQQLESQKRQLERKNARLDDFASLVSHDLRNPMHVVASSVALAREESDSANLERAASAVDRMDDIIDDLLALARTGVTDDERTTVDIDRAVREAWQHTPTDGGSLVAGDDLTTVDADRGQLLHLFENLFRNAVEHNDTAVTVEVGTLEDTAGFYVEDDGIGIPPADHDSVFEHGHTTADDGTGFGLSIVQQIADAHGWTVSLHDIDGARFEFRTEREA